MRLLTTFLVQKQLVQRIVLYIIEEYDVLLIKGYGADYYYYYYYQSIKFQVSIFVVYNVLDQVNIWVVTA